MINIALIANHELTYFYSEIALELQKEEINCFWITPSPKQYEWLVGVYGSNNVLCISRNTPENQSLADLNIHELVYGDRVLKSDKTKGVRYLQNIQKPVFDFIKKNEIKFIFGEKTWAHEELIYRITRDFNELCCVYLSPHTIRIPNGRFAFFETPEMHTIYRKFRTISYNLDTSISIERPDYLKRNDYLLKKKNTLRGLSLRFWKLITFQNSDIGNPCRPQLKNILKTRLIEIYNRRYYGTLKKSSIADIHYPFVFLTLHQQPEATVDVMGRYYEDQKLNIINLWRRLPEGWLLVIKEHSNAIGCRGRSFFADLLKLPNLIIANEQETSIDYLEKAEAIVSVTGTIGLEVILKEKIALLFGNPHFVGYGTCYNISLKDLESHRDLEELILFKRSKQQKSKEEFEKHILKNSFEGIISNPISNPQSMTSDNIKKVSAAFYAVLSYDSEQIPE